MTKLYVWRCVFYGKQVKVVALAKDLGEAKSKVWATLQQSHTMDSDEVGKVLTSVQNTNPEIYEEGHVGIW